MAEDVAIRQVSELQSKGPDIVAEAKKHPVELRRYGDTVAFVISPQQHKRLTELEGAAQRALWAFAIQRGMRSLEEGRVIEWDAEAAERLRLMFPEP